MIAIIAIVSFPSGIIHVFPEFLPSLKVERKDSSPLNLQALPEELVGYTEEELL